MQDDIHGGTILPVLTTKLYRPPVSHDAEIRGSLLEILDRYSHRPLTLISAPAGYGKSTLASMWLERCDCATAWVSLDEGDNDLRAFLAYVVAAIRGAFPGAMLTTPDLLEAPALAPPTILARYLLNDLNRIGEPFVLAMDDTYRVHEQAVYDLLRDLLQHPLPFFHLVLVTRRDPPLPIASLRANGQVTEIRARDLRFSVAETASLLSRRLDRVVDESTAAAWTDRTEGWIVAIHLAALSQQYRGADMDVIRPIAGNRLFLQDYLLAEVIAHLPPARLSWLRAISLLDRFSAPLCEAVCRSDSADSMEELTGAEFIRWLQDSNLFILPLDDRRQWFRFHHLFQDYLRDTLTRTEDSRAIASYHRRASQWFAQEGLIDEAIRHFLMTGDVKDAVQLVARHRHAAMNGQQWSKLEGWLRLLPDDAIARSPQLTSASFYLASYRGVDSDLLASLRATESLLASRQSEDDECSGAHEDVAVMRSLLAAAYGDPESAVMCSQRALKLLPAEALYVRALATGLLGIGMQMQGRYEESATAVERLLADASRQARVEARLCHLRALSCFMEGDLDAMLSLGRMCLQTSEKHMLPETISYARHDLGISHYLRNEYDLAAPLLVSLQQDWAVSAPSYVAYGTFALALIRFAQGRTTDAERLIEWLNECYPPAGGTSASKVAKACGVELQFRMGHVLEARRQIVQTDFGFRPPIWFFWVHQLTPIKLQLAEGGEDSLALARASLENLDEQMRRIHRNSVRIDVLALLALVCDAQGDRSGAGRSLVQALQLARPGGFIRNFVDLGPPMAKLLTRVRADIKESIPELLPHTDLVLAAFGAEEQRSAAMEPPPVLQSQAIAVAPPSPLTERERQVLELLASDLSPREIARVLVVSPATVHTHTKNIFRKLDVTSRYEAVYRAKELALI